MENYLTELAKYQKKINANPGQLETVIRVRNLIEHNFSENLDLEALSKDRFVSKYHLLRLFRKYYGQTPKQYLISTRLNKSKEYLREGMGVTETCFAVGFESPSSFSKLFKSRNGVSPREFRKRAIFDK
ncbi:Helix-turn-helix domain-containing protein [Robiginitalea myxolifaciens]|uniref:Helix-turn-helix domain-containing protein n=1 Tax=Robiginitalea myxolifaciens TaxID=400055 RepID=A0A1I6FQS8_9FLAO|nr:AraC family transcriptional regulator [Robiginitalea myxolifaciens]SFR32301.1 Helix-turn-helix domain-containing protein [Robiginitalea myxolifaciens]